LNIVTSDVFHWGLHDQVGDLTIRIAPPVAATDAREIEVEAEAEAEMDKVESLSTRG
jgi:hypothetical protein